MFNIVEGDKNEKWRQENYTTNWIIKWKGRLFQNLQQLEFATISCMECRMHSLIEKQRIHSSEFHSETAYKFTNSVPLVKVVMQVWFLMSISLWKTIPRSTRWNLMLVREGRTALGHSRDGGLTLWIYTMAFIWFMCATQRIFTSTTFSLKKSPYGIHRRWWN